jgi:uncharacterized delta-60 repeat protein
MWLFAALKTQPTRPIRRVPSSFRPRLEALEDRCLLSGAGSLDTTFGGTGIVTTSLNNDDSASAVLIQPWDGKIVAAGATAIPSEQYVNVMGLVRYNPNGSLDSTFGSGGTVVSKIGGSSTWAGAALYPQSGTANDGKIVEASRSNFSNTSNVARFNPNGSLDKSFGKKGSVTVPFVVASKGVVIQADGKIVVAGRDGPGTEFELTRFNADGSLDSTFGSGGTATLYLGASTTASTLVLMVAVKLQADGKLVTTGFTGSPPVWELARFRANGSLDTTFNSAGVRPGTVTGPYGGNLKSLAIYPSTGTDTADYGKIVVVGNETNDPLNGPLQGVALARYNADGTLDGTFGTSGQVLTSNFNPNSAGKAVVLQSDGKIVVTAQTSDASGNLYRWSLLRYNTDGSLDTSFGTAGLVQTKTGTTDPANTTDFAVAIQADGKIVAAGSTPGSTYDDFMVARYLGAASPPGAPPILPDPVPVGTDTTLTADPVTAVAFQGDAVGAGVLEPGTDTLLGYGTRPRDGTWTQSSATAGWTSGRSRLLVQAQDSDGVFGDPFALPLSVP